MVKETCFIQTILLQRLQPQTLPYATPPIAYWLGKINLIRKIAVHFKQFWNLPRFILPWTCVTYSNLWLKAPFLNVLVWCCRKPGEDKECKSKQSSPWLCAGLQNNWQLSPDIFTQLQPNERFKIVILYQHVVPITKYYDESSNLRHYHHQFADGFPLQRILFTLLGVKTEKG